MQLCALNGKVCGGMHRQHALTPASVEDGQRPIVMSDAWAHCITVSRHCAGWNLDDILGVASELRPNEGLHWP